MSTMEPIRMSAVERMPEAGEPPFHVDLTTNTLVQDKHVTKLTPILAEVIAALIGHYGRGPMHVERMLQKVYGSRADQYELVTLRVHVSRANAKLRLFGWRVRSIRSVGWVLEPIQDAPPMVDPYAHLVLTAERDALRARVAELEAQIAAS